MISLSRKKGKAKKVERSEETKKKTVAEEDTQGAWAAPS